jgi:hypothetical protein
VFVAQPTRTGPASLSARDGRLNRARSQVSCLPFRPSLHQPAPSQTRMELDNAKADHAAYLTNNAPTRDQLAELAAHAVRLARLDDVTRGGAFDPRLWQELVEGFRGHPHTSGEPLGHLGNF